LSVVRSIGTGAKPKLSPTEPLSASQQATFRAVLAHNPHLNSADMPLLTLYVLSLSKAARLAKGKDDVLSFERASRLALTVGTKLRITPQSTRDPQTLGRRRKDTRPNVIDEILAGGDDE
jgi:hypothetical protein